MLKAASTPARQKQIRVRLAPWQLLACFGPVNHMGMFGGVGCGKTYTGSHFSIMRMTRYPTLTHFIGSNSYDQLTQATLRELFYWLDHYGIEFVIDSLPPPEWGVRREFKSYKNVLSLRYRGRVAHAFTRVLSDPNALRGTEFSSYWIDETRDTPQNTHDVLLSRLRESTNIRGLLTSTTNGEDWAYERFVRKNDKSGLYGSMHVKTIEAVKAGILTMQYYQSLLKSYSPLMAAQELDAAHVNVQGGRAYYAADHRNRQRCAPWGDYYPDLSRPLIVGMDFNFQPAPCIWMIGQRGPGEFSEQIHWFGELARSEISSVNMTLVLMRQYPDFFYQIYGDASGTRGATSNAGKADYDQIGQTLADHGAMYSIQVDQANPLVKNRVEAMNSLFRNAVGDVRQTYNPDTCPHFDGDIRLVGWKVDAGIRSGKGRLDNAGDIRRTHASDGAGYAVWKLFPPRRRAEMVEGIASPLIREVVI